MTGVRPSRNRFVTYSTGPRRMPRRHNAQYAVQEERLLYGFLGKVFHHPQTMPKVGREPAWTAEGRTVVSPTGESEVTKAGRSKGKRKRGPAWESADVPDDAYADGLLAERAIDDLRRLKGKDQPFFLAVGFFKPHLPFIAPKKYWDLYDHEKIHLPDNYHVPKDAPKSRFTLPANCGPTPEFRPKGGSRMRPPEI